MKVGDLLKIQLLLLIKQGNSAPLSYLFWSSDHSNAERKIIYIDKLDKEKFDRKRRNVKA